MPATVPNGIEVRFDPNEILVSKTDTRGVIQYANQPFVEISGFTEKELLGAPHSIVRHPDMPRAVFHLLWDRIAAGHEVFAGAFLALAERVNATLHLMEERERAFESVIEQRVLLADDFRDGVQAMAATLAGASTELDATSTTLGDAASRTVDQVQRGEGSAREAVQAIQAVAGAAGELSETFSEISRQSEESTQSTRAAAENAKAASEVMQRIAAAAEGVHGIVEVIGDVARQTNLLALNAAIEAARAGEAGRGFGVVASEVKQLANQTARSTQDIAGRIDAMRKATASGVESMQRIDEALDGAEGFASTISAAIYEQETATQHIVRNAETATASARSVATELVKIGEETRAARQGAVDIQESAGDISSQAERLTAAVDGFLGRMAEG